MIHVVVPVFNEAANVLATVRSGFLHVLSAADPLDVVVTMEGDQTSDPGILMRMLHRVGEEGDDIVLASCYLYGGGIRGTNLHRIAARGASGRL